MHLIGIARCKSNFGQHADAACQQPRRALNLEPTDLGELVNDAAAGITSGTALTIKIEPDLPRLQLDRTRIKLLLRNLLDNAQRHGQRPIDISLRRIDGALQLTVRDHGHGIPEDQLPQLGQRFSGWMPPTSAAPAA